MAVRPNLNQNLWRHFLHLFTFKATERRREFFLYNLFVGIVLFFAYLILGSFTVSLAFVYGHDTHLATVASFSVVFALVLLLNLAAAFRRVRDFGLPGLSIVVFFVVICAFTVFLGEPDKVTVFTNSVNLLILVAVLSLLALFPTKTSNNKYRNPKVFPQAEDEPFVAPAKEEVKAEKTTEVKAEKTTEVKAEQTTEVKAEQTTEAKAEQTTEAKAEEATEAKAEEATEVKAEETTEAKAEEATEVKAEQATEVKAEQATDAKAEEVTEVKAEEATEVKAEQAQATPTKKD
ncbi:hypothetical protein CJP74_05575 [Psittacicella melopsittaci]|uniref:DUF805 domain-containing protein n=1 Tax=Psittacicella melopsittaci TaxID=2028576 RepID=A0A3A1Y3D4_9GAMM|nr:DUF805 domain-containing protein [Psittacicella melopsittaci]RIY32075.1 hypothetical protein CJP74_05575 [Psittacicella melopsittaci]